MKTEISNRVFIKVSNTSVLKLLYYAFVLYTSQQYYYTRISLA
jgi:uncharacterized phage-associated protein